MGGHFGYKIPWLDCKIACVQFAVNRKRGFAEKEMNKLKGFVDQEFKLHFELILC